MPRVYSRETGEPLDVATPEEASQLLLGGKYALPKGTRQAVQMPDGTSGHIDSEHVADAVAAGAKFIGDDGWQDYELKKKYGGGVANTAIANTEEAARVASLGISDVALKPLLGSEHLRAEEKYNTTWPGTVVGAVAPMLVGDEAGPIAALKGAGEAVEGGRALGGAEEAARVAEAAPDAAGTIVEAKPSPLANADAQYAAHTQVPGETTVGRPGQAPTRGSSQFVAREPEGGSSVYVAREPDATAATQNLRPPAPEVSAAGAPGVEPGLEDTFVRPAPVSAAAEPAAVPETTAGGGPGLFQQGLQQGLRAVTAPARAVSGLGDAAASLATEHLAELGFSPTMQRIGASVARGAVEAPLYQVGQNISDDVFEDHDFTAQSLLAHTGTAALFGGAFGGSVEAGLSVAGKYAPPALERFAKWADRQQARLGLPESTYKSDFDAALRATARMSDNLDDLEKHWNNELKPALVQEALGQENSRAGLATNLLFRVTRYLETAPFNTALKGRVEKLQIQLGKDLGLAKNDADRFMAFEDFKKGSDAFLKTTKKALGGDDILLRQGVTEAVGVVRESLGAAERWGRAGEIQAQFNARYAPYIQARDAVRRLFFEKGGLVEGESRFVPKANIIGNYLDRRAKNSYDKFKRSKEILDNYHDRAQSLGEVYGGYSELGVGGEAVDVHKLAQHIDEMHGAFEQAIESRRMDLQGMTKAETTPHLGWHHVPGVAGVLNASTRMLGVHPLLKVGMGVAAHAAGVPLGGMAAGVAGLAALKMIRGGKSEFIANIAKAGAANARAVSDHLDAFLNGEAGKVATGSRTFTLGDSAPKRGESDAAAHARVVDELKQAAAANQSGIDVAGQKALDATPEMGRFAPNVQRALAATTSRIAAYLASVAPHSHIDSMGLHDAPYMPSASESSGFNRQIRTASAPMTTFDDLKAGTITPSQVTTLETIYPAWFSGVRAQLAAKIASKSVGFRMPYQKKLALGIFMGGAATHDSLRPASISRIQQAYAPVAPEAPTGGRSRTPRAPALGKLNFSGAASTRFSSGPKSH